MRKTRWVWTVLFVSVFVVGAGLIPPRSASGASQTMSAGCQEVNDPFFDGSYGVGTILGWPFFAGESVVLRASDNSVSHTISLTLDGTIVDTSPFPGQVSYQFTADETVNLSWQVDTGIAQWDANCYAPGCDAFLPLTADAVVGRFVQDAPLYWAPGELIDPRVTIPAGKTAWVLGRDASGHYYQIIWACDKLWVPAETLGPNVGDPVWQGAPLPSGVVP